MRSTQQVDTYAKDELRLYAENTSELYPQFMAIVRNVQRRIARGTYDAEKSPRLWLYWVDAAAKRYAREFGGTWTLMFNSATRRALARELSIDVYRAIERGEYGDAPRGAALAIANPVHLANPLSSAKKAGLAVGAVAAVLLIGYAVFGGSSAAASSTKSGGGSTAPGGTPSGGGSSTPVGPPLGGKSGAPQTWQAAKSLVQGKTYRASADVADALTAMGFTVYTDHDVIPSDWPSSDLDPKRWRVDGVWNGPSMPLPSTLPGDAKIFELVGSKSIYPGQTWQPATMITQGKRYRASLDVKSDASALGFTVWDQYDAVPGDWPSSDAGPNRWRVEGVWTAATVPDLSTFGNALVAMGVPVAEALKVAGDVRLYELV